MKKIQIILLALSALFIFSGNVFAGTGTVAATTEGKAVTFAAEATLDLPALTFNPSPSVSMAAATTRNDFVISSMSVQTKADQGLVYGIVSSMAGFYQRVKTAADVTAGTTPGTATVAAGTTTIQAWTYMGGKS